jgi:hypothetical protein
MKTIFSSRRNYYIARVSVFLITVALIAGMVGCAQPAQYSLTISSTEGGEVTTPGGGTSNYAEGTAVSLVAFPHTGYRFLNWTGDVSAVDDVNAASTTITMNGDYEITANFEAIPPAQYSLTISNTTGGSVTTPREGTFTYNAGTIVNLVAKPDSGYQFVNWAGDVGTIGNVSAASTTITMNGNYSVKANFEEIRPIQYKLTISSTAGGSVTTPGEGTFTYAEGTAVSLVATPAWGHWFDKWTGDVATLSCGCQSTTITMNGNYSIVANFG